ncbi:MAG TPA: helix-turn-helix domain-containing protein, partial [Crinalium sp.]
MPRASTIHSRDDREAQIAAGLTLADALALSPELGDLFRWMTRQRELSLTDVMAFAGEDEPTTRRMLDELIRQGFVQEVAIGQETYYRAHFADKRGRQLAENIWQSLTPGSSPLTVVRNPSGVPSVVAGSVFELYVTVNNEGNQSALVDVSINETCQPLHQWCAAPFERLALGPKQSGEVVFHIEVPLQTLPGTYDYLLIVDA